MATSSVPQSGREVEKEEREGRRGLAVQGRWRIGNRCQGRRRRCFPTACRLPSSLQEKALAGAENGAGGGRRERSRRGRSRRGQRLVLRSRRFKALRAKSSSGPVSAFEESWRRRGQEMPRYCRREATPAVGPKAAAAASWLRALPSMPWSQPVPSP